MALAASQIPSPIKWHGGKNFIADWIISLFPPHTHYVEPYAGGLSVLLRKPFEGVSEVINDLDRDVVNFWHVLREGASFQEFCRQVEATPFSQQVFEESRTACSWETPVQRAVRFFAQCRQSRQGLRKDFATLSKNRTRRGMNEQVSSWLTAIDGLPEIHTRLKRVVVFCKDAIKVIQSEDTPNTFFYLDPPYVSETRVTTNDYVCEMSWEGHKTLLETLSNVRGRFALSGYRCDLYDSLAGMYGWLRSDKSIDCKSSAKAVKPMRTESVWTNYEPLSFSK